MPMVKGKSNKAVSKNISMLVGEGWPRKRAIAASLTKAGRSRSKKKVK